MACLPKAQHKASRHFRHLYLSYFNKIRGVASAQNNWFFHFFSVKLCSLSTWRRHDRRNSSKRGCRAQFTTVLPTFLKTFVKILIRKKFFSLSKTLQNSPTCDSESGQACSSSRNNNAQLPRTILAHLAGHVVVQGGEGVDQGLLYAVVVYSALLKLIIFVPVLLLDRKFHLKNFEVKLKLGLVNRKNIKLIVPTNFNLLTKYYLKFLSILLKLLL